MTIFSTKLKNGVVDVWWLYDDGGKLLGKRLIMITSQAASTYVRKCRMRHVERREMLAWTCSRGAANSICLCGKYRWTAGCYPFGVGTSKKNMFAMLGIRLTRQTANKPLFGIHPGLPQSRNPRSHSRTDVDIPTEVKEILDHIAGVVNG